MTAENQQKHLEFTFSIKAPSFHSRTSIRAHKNILWYLEWLYCWKSRGDNFFQRDSILILVSRTVKTRKFKLLYFRNDLCYGNENLYRDLLFVYLQPSLNKNSQNLAILNWQFDDVIVKPSILTKSRNASCHQRAGPTWRANYVCSENSQKLCMPSVLKREKDYNVTVR